MKITAMLVLSGSCLSLLLVGCQKHDMLSKRGYIQAPDGKYYQSSGMTSSQPSEIEKIEQATQAPAVPSERVKTTVIKPEETRPQYNYQPTETISRQPVRPAIAAPEKYIVKKGDYLGKIGRQYGVGAAKLAAYNKIDINKPIQIGQIILVPPPGTAVHISEATRKAATKPRNTKSSSTTTAKSVESTKISDGHYIVKPGDSVSRIAARYSVKRSALMSANNINENSILRIGQKLVIPGKTTNESSAPIRKPATTAAVTPPIAVDTTPVPQDILPSEQGTADDILSGVKDPVSDTPQLPVAPSTKTSPSAIESATPAIPAATQDLHRRSSIEVTTDTTLAQIASQYGVNLEALKKANSDIKEGQTIRSGRLIFLPEQ